MQKIPKQIIVVRKDLNMRRGKQIAQGAHASLKAILDLGKIVRTHPQESDEALIIDITQPFNPALHQWITGRFTKICVYVNSEQELLDVYNQAKDAGLICSLITDAGLTEFNNVPTITCCAIGPAFPDEVDPITKHLPLL
jgi:PTH2 family peptidyl-tRNA hydrolase